MSTRFMPVSFFGAAMGLGGLALVSRAASAELGTPGWLAEAWALIAVLASIAITVAYLHKWRYHTDAARAELADPARMGFFGSIAIAWALAAGCIGPYAPDFARALWWIAAALMVATQIAAMARWLAGGIELAHINTGWMIAFIGPVPVAGPGILVGEVDGARIIFAASAFATPILAAMVMFRSFVGPALADAMKPTLFILLVPFSLVFAYAPVLWGVAPGPLLDAVFAFTLVMALALVVFARGAARWPFGPAWWAFTFPLDAFAVAALAFARNHPAATALAWAAWAVATVVVVLVLIRTLRALGSGRLFAPPLAPAPG